MLSRKIPTLKTFENYLEANGLSPYTLSLYRNYFKKFQIICSRYDGEVNQDIINGFTSVYQNTVVKAMLRNLLEMNNWMDLRVPKTRGAGVQKEKRFIPEKEVLQMAEYLNKNHRTPMYAIMLLITYYAGLRRKETINILATDIYWEDWQMNTDKPCRIKINWHGAKRSKERIGVLPQWVVKEIWNYIVLMKKHLPERVFQQYLHGEKRLFELSSVAWHNKFKDACRHIDRDYTLHELRFSYATSLYKRGYSMMEIKEMLGHSNITTTQRYIKEDREAILRKLEQEFSNNK